MLVRLLVPIGLSAAIFTSDAMAAVGIEPYIASRRLSGDASDLFEGGYAKGIALSLGFPFIPLRPRGSIDFSSHDAKESGGGELDGTVITLDVLFDFGIGLIVPYALAGVGVSNLNGKPTPAEAQDAYESGKAFGRVGAGLRAGLGRRLAVTGEASYARGGKGNELIQGELGALSFFDLRLGVLFSL